MLAVPGGWRVVSLPVGAGERDEPRMLWLHKRRRNAEEKPETSSCESGSIATRSVTYSKYSSIGALITPSRERWASFSTPSPSLSPQSYYALSRGGVPSRLGPPRTGSYSPYARGFSTALPTGALVTPPGARPRAVLDACILLKATATGEGSPRTGGRPADLRRPVLSPWRERRLF